MRTVNIHEAKTHLSRLVEDAAQGEEIVIAKAGKPVARLVPLAAPERRVPKLGTMKGKIWMADDWDSPETNEAIWAEFWENIEKEP
jgi:prevent-host-death family protein